MYIIVEKTYPMKDMVHFDGENIEVWINQDLRRQALAEGFTINANEIEEVDMAWEAKLRMNCKVIDDDGVNSYEAILQSPRELTSSRGVVTPSVYSQRQR